MGLVFVRGDTLCAWRGASLLITTMRGECGDAHPLSGFYYREARFLRTCRIEIDGEFPWMCEASAVSRDMLDFAYVFPEVAGGEGGGSGQAGDQERRSASRIPQRAIETVVRHHVVSGHLTITATVTNRSRETVRCEFAWALDADFADIQEAQSRNREQQAQVETSATASSVVFRYAHQQIPYSTRISLAEGFEWRDGRAVRPLELQAHQQTTFALHIDADAGQGVVAEQENLRRDAAIRQWREGFTRIDCSNEIVARVLASNIDDFASFPLLEGPEDEWLVPQAGVPLYPAFFGRDGVTAGWQAAMVDRGALLDATLTRLGRMQSDRTDDWRDEQPGRIPYQVRTGPLAILNLNPYAAYYADFASPLMYVISLANLFAWSGDRARLDAHWDTARRILDWAREYGDADRDGYLEYQTRSSKGTKNQGWKDSGDAVIYDDGRPVPSPIATCELQGYWYAAQQLFGLLCAARGQHAESRAWLDAAAALKERFNRDWWSERAQCVGLALDPDKRLIDAPTSNAGHCLATGIVDDDKVPALVGRLFAPDMFSGWGVRTLSSDHAHYDPVSYHRGSVWAVEQATILFGLRRFGFNARADDLAQALFDLADLYPGARIPETVGGYARVERISPSAYPQANAPQLWNATAFPLTVQALLGLLPWAAANVLLIDPVLPAWMREVTVRNLRVGQATVTLHFYRNRDGTSDYDIVHAQGDLHVVRQPSPDSLSATLADRVWGPVWGLLK